MANFQILNAQAHQNLKVITSPSIEHGDNMASTLTFPTEFGDIQHHYPILFSKNPDTGEFCSTAILGLKAGENLFLDGNHWNANYIPINMVRGPFLIGFQNQQKEGRSENEPVINIDMDNPRVNETEGEMIFNQDGSLSSYAEEITQLLSAIHQGIEVSKSMFAAFLEFDLIEPVALDIQLDSGEQIKLSGHYTIHEEKLAKLNGDALLKLHQQGFLQAAFLVVASLNNIKTLIKMKNERG